MCATRRSYVRERENNAQIDRLVKFGLLDREEAETFKYVVGNRIGGTPIYWKLLRMEPLGSAFIANCDIPFGFPKMMERLQEAKKRLYKIEPSVWLGTEGKIITRLV